jgi:hypothetical protein
MSEGLTGTEVLTIGSLSFSNISARYFSRYNENYELNGQGSNPLFYSMESRSALGLTNLIHNVYQAIFLQG